ncbi:hypothetical protein [Streptomyces sp. NPDC017890]|uniref:hypothetical protein n=1 Tax=Streptomyces sp. NPDC017890 TaxID=3365015 RepID=UPI0037A67D9E
MTLTAGPRRAGDRTALAAGPRRAEAHGGYGAVAATGTVGAEVVRGRGAREALEFLLSPVPGGALPASRLAGPAGTPCPSATDGRDEPVRPAGGR